MEKFTRRDMLKATVGFIGIHTIPNIDTFPNAELETQLYTYRESIKEKKGKYLEIISQHNIYGGKNTETTIQEQIEDFSLYADMYIAVEEKYGIPADIIWKMHHYETTVSKDPNPGRGKFIGAMQRAQVHPDSQVYDAISGYEFLELLPQRYKKGIGIQWEGNTRSFESSDYAELLWSGKFISNHAKNRMARHPNYYKNDYKKAVLDVIRYDYSSEASGAFRAREIAQSNSLFN